MNNSQVAEMLENIADMLEIKSESVFKIRAYRDAARRIESLTEPIQQIIQRGELCEIPGVGESIAAKIIELVQTGKLAYYEDLRKQVNPGVADLLEVPGIGPKKAKLFYDELGIDSVEKLEQAAREHMLSSSIPKIGEKTEQNILQSIERMRARQSTRVLLGVALPNALPILDMVRGFPEVDRAEIAGSLRRMQETIGDIDLLAASDDPKTVIDKFTDMSMVRSVLAHGPTKGTIVIDGGMQVDLRVVKPEEYGAALQYFTGSKPHNIRIRDVAISKGLKVNEYGVFRVADDRRVAGDTEPGVYQALGLEMMPPEIREDCGEIEASMAGKLPDLIRVGDLKGDLHMHTKWSDGADTPEAMVRAAIERGYEYIAISDHSVSMGFIHGLTIEQIAEQRELIDELNRKYPEIRILHGIEVNIRSDGKLDYDDDVLAAFDVVTASVHGAMGMTREQMTKRIIRAVANQHVDILGHPTGRVIGKRDPYEVDLEAVMAAALKHHTALEINSQPDRLDLKDTDARLARDKGVMLAIDSDAHSSHQLGIVEYGIATARRGWVEPRNVVNTLPLAEFLEWLQGETPATLRRAA